MLNKLKKYISEKIISLVDRNESKKQLKKWQEFLSNPNINIHPTFVPQNTQVFKGDNKKIGNIRIDEHVLLREHCNILVYPDAELIIGKGVFFNNCCSVNCLERIEIGDDTIFGEGVKLYDHNHLIEKSSVIHVEKEKYTKDIIKIGENCWIGSNVVILKGVTIGDNSVIGAGCIIHKSVPPNTIVKHNQNLIYESL
ncbi:acyltransferase [Chryseobacterium daecheongense]|uniref:Acyltransferase n=1 Tax=Chryseobacterium daecheongense TaxID=192389 RepID=A0A3N0VSI5_9FLAO|nr:acyltransferase [Chryseobacterium daecheongense]ROH95777.1 acyltransferase [Chryseobacterium daecheongense]TDX91836.1 transferase family hexapeptide repeat protein [Chryseobacterium daecheongense]